MQCGISIQQRHFNTFCYADDILLCSLTASGLQKLLDAAVARISSLGLRFNPEKTKCVIYGPKSQVHRPDWMIEEKRLSIVSSIPYLGVILDGENNWSGAKHVDNRIAAAQKAFYGLQGAGLHGKGVTPSLLQ